MSWFPLLSQSEIVLTGLLRFFSIRRESASDICQRMIEHWVDPTVLLMQRQEIFAIVTKALGQAKLTQVQGCGKRKFWNMGTFEGQPAIEIFYGYRG